VVNVVADEVVIDALGQGSVETAIRLEPGVLSASNLANSKVLKDRTGLLSEGVIRVEEIRAITTSGKKKVLFATRVLVEVGRDIIDHVVDTNPYAGVFRVVSSNFLPSIALGSVGR
jgi:hypothetical protein